MSDLEIAEEIRRLTATARELSARMDDAAAQDRAYRTPSKAHLIGPGFAPAAAANTDHFFATIARANSPKLAGGFQASIDAKASLDDMGSYWMAPDPAAKATVGDTDAAGGYLVPQPVVAAINEQATPRRGVFDLFSVISGVRGGSVDIPFENDSLTRAQIALPGATKENANAVWGGYTATLYTLARIFDVGNQLLRQSAGAAEQSVRSRLARAFALGEDHYILNGTGTNQPYGLLTALAASSSSFTSTFSSPADNTIAGSVAAAVATAAGDLENRGAIADGAVMNTRDYWRLRRQGTEEAGYFIDPSQPANRDLSLFGIRIRHTPNVASDTLVVGEFSSTEVFRGDSYRVDTSSEAGDRWDKNLTGFRGEEEIAADLRPAVYAGKFQRVTNAVGA